MNYSLIFDMKQLRDLGFPSILSNEGKSGVVGRDCIKLDSIWYCIPTLSELIEALPVNNSFCLSMPVGWIASIKRITGVANGTIESKQFTGEGSTPEEAVASLWIELNK